ncbi:MAG: UDP-N-acetylmuramoyl-L-alanyl-D-glutamate--2,6-diaminopimelate ligase [Acidobacteria bacterium]|nr:MAG: UDP-N-acetylmuramoyl-L-alanyl-D-glutamate--2,6-diaminopimelate ligase [Acidobacteriota bacterium]
MLLGEILAQIPRTEARGDLQVSVREISYDSRAVEAGDLFVAIRGQKTDGNLHIPQAMDRGAVAIASEIDPDAPPDVVTVRVADARNFLAQASQVFFRQPASQLKLVGITGTNGKTTTTYLMDSVLRQAGYKPCLVGTLGLQIGDQPYPSHHTTPEAPDLLRFLRRALDEGCTHGALEVSSHALALKRVFGTRFVVGVFTNLTPDHLDFHGTMESYYHAKRLLFAPEGENGVELAAINTDDAWGRRLASETSSQVLCYGLGKKAHVRALEFRNRIDGTDLRVATPRGEVQIATKLIGRPNVYNVLAAVCASVGLELDLEHIRNGIEALPGVPGRMETVDCGQAFTVLVDYAHTPDALEKALETVLQLPHHKVITVFGCGGDRDKTKRPVMGDIASRLSDLVFATSDNPRSEDPKQILAEIEPGLQQGKAQYRLIVDRGEAIAAAIHSARRGDVVLIAGKGHEDYQVIGNKTVPFDDRQLARQILTQIRHEGGS